MNESNVSVGSLYPVRRPLTLTLLLLTAIAIGFWTQSRYPNLTEKALMGSAARLDSPLGFEKVIELPIDAPLIAEIAATALGWFDTNLRGMSFGLLFAGGILLLGPLLGERLLLGRWAATLTGTLIGAPLGVCANCAAPIASSLLSAGARAETAVAAMISSPTLNAIVLTMLFALFPWYLIVTRLALTLSLVFLVPPFLMWWLEIRGLQPRRTGKLQTIGPFASLEVYSGKTWNTALSWLLPVV